MEDRARILESRVEDLTREIVRAINEVDDHPGLRAELKDFAIGLLQDAVPAVEAIASEPAPAPAAQFNPLAMGIPLMFAGAVLIFLFPPVGLLLFVASGFMVVWGLAVSLFRRR